MSYEATWVLTDGQWIAEHGNLRVVVARDTDQWVVTGYIAITGGLLHGWPTITMTDLADAWRFGEIYLAGAFTPPVPHTEAPTVKQTVIAALRALLTEKEAAA